MSSSTSVWRRTTYPSHDCGHSFVLPSSAVWIAQVGNHPSFASNPCDPTRMLLVDLIFHWGTSLPSYSQIHAAQNKPTHTNQMPPSYVCQCNCWRAVNWFHWRGRNKFQTGWKSCKSRICTSTLTISNRKNYSGFHVPEWKSFWCQKDSRIQRIHCTLAWRKVFAFSSTISIYIMWFT